MGDSRGGDRRLDSPVRLDGFERANLYSCLFHSVNVAQLLLKPDPPDPDDEDITFRLMCGVINGAK